ncbi:DUF4097 family beta strand repeat-containing protein [Pseudobacillus sp. FSL P4-0506]|uniref:DUF4097 family beta strand repeat-containing protein n=1 Tax=unclassified Pseudobacillus TaxID=2619284 RepID=UPI0030FB02F7
MLRKMFVLLLLGTMGAGLILYLKQPVKTVAIGGYKAMPYIDITLDELNIDIADSPDDKIHLQIKGHTLNKNILSVSQKNNTFVLKETRQKKKWQENIHFRPMPTVVMKLPKSQSKALTINGAYGDLIIQGLELDTIQAGTSAGMAHVKNVIVSNAEFSTADGMVKIAKSSLKNLSITTDAGDVSIKESTGTAHTIRTADGQIKITEATEQPNIQLKSVSGDIGIQYIKTPASLQLVTAGEDMKIELPKYDRNTHAIGDGTNRLSAKTEDGGLVIQ